MELAERTALQQFKDEAAIIRSRAFNAMSRCLRMTDAEVVHTGYKSREAAAIGMFKSYAQQIDALQKDFLTKYPDEK